MEALSALVDDALADPARAEIESHLAGCPRCAAALADLHALHARFAALPGLRVGFDLVPVIEDRIRAAERPPRPRRMRKGARWWQVLPAALGTAVALSAGAYLGSALVVAGPGAGQAAIEMSAFDTVPPGGICLGSLCAAGGR
jgi:anti-sigma factor RsiW